jgi:hypothetical protein
MDDIDTDRAGGLIGIWPEIVEDAECETFCERADLVLGVAHRAFVEPRLATVFFVAES